MKGVPGIVLALGLGLGGALLSWFYLERLAGREARVGFIGIRSNVQLNAGEAISADHIVRVDVPRSGVGNLEQVAPLWDYQSTVVGQTSNRSYRGGELVLYQDIRTPGQRDLNEKLGPDEVAIWLPVDPRTFNASRVNPDDDVSFLIPRLPGGSMGSLSPIPETDPVQPLTGIGSDIIGPFRILEIGNRTGRTDVFRAAGNRGGNETSITIVAKLVNGRLEAKAERITEYLRTTRSQGLQVMLHSKKR